MKGSNINPKTKTAVLVLSLLGAAGAILGASYREHMTISAQVLFLAVFLALPCYVWNDNRKPKSKLPTVLIVILAISYLWNIAFLIINDYWWYWGYEWWHICIMMLLDVLICIFLFMAAANGKRRYGAKGLLAEAAGVMAMQALVDVAYGGLNQLRASSLDDVFVVPLVYGLLYFAGAAALRRRALATGGGWEAAPAPAPAPAEERPPKPAPAEDGLQFEELAVPLPDNNTDE